MLTASPTEYAQLPADIRDYIFTLIVDPYKQLIISNSKFGPIYNPYCHSLLSEPIGISDPWLDIDYKIYTILYYIFCGNYSQIKLQVQQFRNNANSWHLVCTRFPPFAQFFSADPLYNMEQIAPLYQIRHLYYSMIYSLRDFNKDEHIYGHSERGKWCQRCHNHCENVGFLYGVLCNLYHTQTSLIFDLLMIALDTLRDANISHIPDISELEINDMTATSFLYILTWYTNIHVSSMSIPPDSYIFSDKVYDIKELVGMYTNQLNIYENYNVSPTFKIVQLARDTLSHLFYRDADYQPSDTINIDTVTHCFNIVVNFDESFRIYYIYNILINLKNYEDLDKLQTVLITCYKEQEIYEIYNKLSKFLYSLQRLIRSPLGPCPDYNNVILCEKLLRNFIINGEQRLRRIKLDNQTNSP